MKKLHPKIKPIKGHEHNWALAPEGTKGRKLKIEWCTRCDKSRDKKGKLL